MSFDNAGCLIFPANDRLYMSTEHGTRGIGHSLQIRFTSLAIGSVIASLLVISSTGAAGYYYIENGHLNEDKTGLENQIGELQNEKLALQTDVTDLSEQVEDLGGKVSNLNSTNESLNNRVGSLNNQVENLNGQLTLSAENVAKLKEVGTFLIDQAAALESVLLETDSNSLDYITWLTNNTYLRDGVSQSTSDNYYYQWLSIQNSTTDDYYEIEANIEDAADQIVYYLGL
jgi:cell division protein FtsB